ncbi:MAG: flagellar hook-length control protein FliK [Magnetococcus sp. XQGC-1]
MIISGVLLPSKELPTATAPTVTPQYTPGEILTGRVTQLNDAGQGVVRFADGSGFSFLRAPGLKMGEPVQVEVLRNAPDLAFRLLGSSSQVAAQLAASAEQSLVRAPDLFAHLLRWAALSEQNQALLQNSLPNISVNSLLDGDLTALANLLETGSRQDVRAMIQQLRQGSVALLLAENPTAPPGESLESTAVRHTLHRLGDLLAMQEILPRLNSSPEGNQLLGYRLYWLTEGGMGEAIWYKKRQYEAQEESDGAEEIPSAGEKSITTVLLSLNMTNLGAVQAQLSYGDGLCSIRIAAEQEQSLTALRSGVSTLRTALLEAALPLRSLELMRLMPGEVKTNRMQALGLASHFYAEA